MSKIVCFAGSKQSGKSSAVNFITGLELCSLGLISSFKLNEKGELVVPTTLENGDIVEGIWDSNQTALTWEGLVWLDENVFPFIKSYGFADTLKRICIEIFGLTYEQVNGTDEEKNTPIDILWENLPHYIEIKQEYKKKNKPAPTGKMTARQFMQEFGTGICRRIKQDCWRKFTLDQIKKEDTELAAICDGRFIDEVEDVLNAGGKVIYLTKNSDNNIDGHSSETGLSNFEGFSAVIDNKDMTIQEKNDKIYQILRQWNYIQFELKTNNNEYETTEVRI